MPEPDVYADDFQLNLTPFGATLNFRVTNATPSLPGTPHPVEARATVRVSLELLKLITYILRHQVLALEASNGIRIAVSPAVLNGSGIGREDWDALWDGR